MNKNMKVNEIEQTWLDWYAGLPADKQHVIRARIEQRVAQITCLCVARRQAGAYPTEPNLWDNVQARYVLREYYRFCTDQRWQAFYLTEHQRQAAHEPCYYLQALRAKRAAK